MIKGKCHLRNNSVKYEFKEEFISLHFDYKDKNSSITLAFLIFKLQKEA